MVWADPNRVLIVGYGYVGASLAQRLVHTGYQVFTLRRGAIELPRHSGILAFQGDARDAASLANLPGDIGQIVCATSPDERTERAYQSAYPEVVAALLAHFPLARMILISSTAVYGQIAGEVVDDHADARTDHPLARQLKHAEDLLLHQSHSGPLRNAPYLHHVVVRASGIYGPGRTSLLASLLHHELTEQESSKFSCRIHRDDLVGILEFLLKRQNLFGIFNATDPTPAQLGEIARWARRELTPDALATSGRAQRERKNRRIVPARLLQLGYAFRFPSYAEGYKSVLERISKMEHTPPRLTPRG